MHDVRWRAPERHRALIAVDEGLLGGIDQAVHEMGVAVGDVPPVEYMSKLLRDLVRISTKKIMTAITEMKLIMWTSIVVGYRVET